jgi:biotin carboxylase
MRSCEYLVFIESNTTGSGVQALIKARELGLEPVLFTRNPGLYPSAADTGATIVTCETNEPAALRHALDHFLLARPGQVCGMTTTSEFYLVATATLAAERQLPTNPPEMVRICRQKGRTRAILTEAGLPQPRFVEVRHAADALAAVAHCGLPCVVKPGDDTGSYGVRLCTTVDEVRAHIAYLLGQRTNVRGQAAAEAVICEEYLEAPEFSVETFACGGRITCIGVTEKRVTGLPYFVECGHIFPAPLSRGTREAIVDTTQRALEHLGNSMGPMHTEVKWTRRGCVIVEINARLAGGMIPELVWQARRVDLLKGQIHAACGWPPTLEAGRKGFAGIHFLTAPTSGRLVGVDNLERVRGAADVVHVTLTAHAGQAVRPPQSAYDRLGYAILRGETVASLEARLGAVGRELAVHVAPDGAALEQKDGDGA